MPRDFAASNCPDSTALIPDRIISDIYAAEFKPNAIEPAINISGFIFNNLGTT